MLNNETLVFWVGWAHWPDYAEATTGGVYYKKGLWSFFLLKRNSNTGAFLLWILEIFKDIYLWTAGSNYGNLAMFFEKIYYTE